MAFTQGFDGRLQDLKIYDDYEKAFQYFQKVMCTPNIYRDEYPPSPLFCYGQNIRDLRPLSSSEFMNVIHEHDEVVVWVTLGFPENLLMAFLIRLFTLYSLPLEKINVQKIETQNINGKTEPMLSMGMIPPNVMKAAPPPSPLTQAEIDLLIRGWEAITSSSAKDIDDYLAFPTTTRFQEGFMDFRQRLPCAKTGLNRCQTDLLEAYPLEQPSVSAFHLIGTAMGKNLENRLDMVFDFYIHWNFLLITNLQAAKPAFILKDPLTREVSITDFGRALREGKANWQDDNPVDYYVGGLHIHSMPESPQQQP